MLVDTVAALCEAEHLDVDVSVASKLAWSAMQGLLVLHPTMLHLDELEGREPASREELVMRFNRILVDGLRAHRVSSGR
ncbi:MAG: hypothetical protein MUE78_11665 [Ilumatobacteraceae bacterium]|nr:hypothetical protein [Ilumatobacteraceae bacterium]